MRNFTAYFDNNGTEEEIAIEAHNYHDADRQGREWGDTLGIEYMEVYEDGCEYAQPVN